MALTLPRATVATAAGRTEWTSRLVPRYQRRLAEVNTAVLGTYLAGGNTRRIRGALALLHGAPLSGSAVSRIVATLTSSLAAWQARPLGDLELVYVYLDALALRVRSGGKVVSLPVLAVVGVRADGQRSSSSWTCTAANPTRPERAASRASWRGRSLLSRMGPRTGERFGLRLISDGDGEKPSFRGY